MFRSYLSQHPNIFRLLLLIVPAGQVPAYVQVDHVPQHGTDPDDVVVVTLAVVVVVVVSAVDVVVSPSVVVVPDSEVVVGISVVVVSATKLACYVRPVSLRW